MESISGVLLTLPINLLGNIGKFLWRIFFFWSFTAILTGIRTIFWPFAIDLRSDSNTPRQFRSFYSNFCSIHQGMVDFCPIFIIHSHFDWNNAKMWAIYRRILTVWWFVLSTLLFLLFFSLLLLVVNVVVEIVAVLIYNWHFFSFPHAAPPTEQLKSNETNVLVLLK